MDDEELLTPEQPVSRFSLKKTWVRLLVFVTWIAVIAVLVFCTLTFARTPIPKHETPEVHLIRHDCHPDHESSSTRKRTNCETRGCLWDEASALIPCYYPSDYQNYEYSLLSSSSRGTRILLKKTGRSSGFANDIQIMDVRVKGLSDDVVHITMDEFVPTTDEGRRSRRWKPPLPVLRLIGGVVCEPKWSISVEKGDVRISRNDSTGQLLFHTDFRKAIFADQFLQLVVDVSSDSLYGFGERMDRHEKSLDSLTHEDEGLRFRFLNRASTKASSSSFGSHPFYLMYENETKDAHGVLLFNSNPSDVTFRKGPTLTYRTIGGIMDFLIFLGPNPLDVIRQKAEVIGHSPLPPYWALGFHLSRWGYQTDRHMRRVYEENIRQSVPVDAMWADIEYMDNNNTFTVDPDKFSGLQQFVQDLHSDGRHFVPIVDPAISSVEGNETSAYQVYARGLEKNVYVLNESTGQPLVTKVWNPVSVIPDFTHPNACSWWAGELERLHDLLPFDGLWLDMNEPTTMDEDGVVSQCDSSNRLNHPQYNPVHPHPLSRGTICMSANQSLSTHYDLHNLFSLFQSLNTFLAVEKIKPGKRPFIVSRATTTGQGAYSAHWTGDLESSFTDMRYSVSSLLDASLFGLPFVGSDVCGFAGDASQHLCSRWSAVGAFYPFVRNHNDRHSRRQDPAGMSGPSLRSAVNNLHTRYQLLPYLYGRFFENAITGHPVVRSLKMNFPDDDNVSSIDQQFMWGDAVLITPVLESETDVVSAYFPAGKWYDFNDMGMVVSQSPHGQQKELSLKWEEISVTVRAGHILPIKRQSVTKTADHKDMPFDLIVALDEEGKASGRLYWDDGDGDLTLERKQFFVIDFQVENKTFHCKPVQKYEGFTGSLSLKRLNLWSPGEATSASITKESGECEACSLLMQERTGVVEILMPHETDMSYEFQVKWSLA